LIIPSAASIDSRPLFMRLTSARSSACACVRGENAEDHRYARCEAASIKPRAHRPPQSKCGVSPRIAQPSAITASFGATGGEHLAASGSPRRRERLDQQALDRHARPMPVAPSMS
jgi:hypothetical protein